jgi:hypothetical protein
LWRGSFLESFPSIRSHGISLSDMGFPFAYDQRIDEFPGQGARVRVATEHRDSLPLTCLLNGIWASYCALSGMTYILITELFDRFSLRLLFVLQLSFVCLLVLLKAEAGSFAGPLQHPFVVVQNSHWLVIVGWSLTFGVITMAVVDMVVAATNFLLGLRPARGTAS